MEIADQRLLWDRQHAVRGAIVEGNSDLRFKPNDTAVIFARLLPPGSRILEIGSANGRDARYWASLGYEVVALDFSQIALNQLREIGQKQGVMEKIFPVVWDIKVGHLPFNRESYFDAFYARSALHVDDTTMMQLADNLDKLLSDKSILLIEGKGPNDEKILRSRKQKNGIAIDDMEGGHVRRIWTLEFLRSMCDRFGWDIVQLSETQEEWIGVPAMFMRLIASKNK